ncbi:MAG: DUF1211 domain-containing protein [Phormidium tanganyikae FI6-MK23]|jgi:uncharacterized membrane protein|nr:DUF1211 domain-containing protein [Phormidium tanganyikae FI6-MK23]
MNIKQQSTDPSTHQTLGTQRIETLVDGVFAIVLTLLVLDIQAPEATSEMDWLRKLWELRENIFSYLVSFIVLGTFWYGHTIEFHYVQRSDRIHIWLNLVFLLCIAFIPFSASLIGQDGQLHTASVVYGLNLLLTGIVRYWHWYYITSGHRLVDVEMELRLIRTIRRRFLMVPFAYLLAIFVSLLNTRIGLLLYALIPVLYIHRVRGSSIATSVKRQTPDIE